MGYLLTNMAKIVTIYALNSFIVLILLYYPMYNSLCYYFHNIIYNYLIHGH